MNNIIVWLVVGAVLFVVLAGFWMVGRWLLDLMDEIGEDGILI